MWVPPSRHGASPHLGAPLVRHLAGAVVDTRRLTWAPLAREGASSFLGGGQMCIGLGTKQERWQRVPLCMGAPRETGCFTAFGRRRWVGNKHGRLQMGATSRGRGGIDGALAACREQFQFAGAPLGEELRT